MDLSLYWPITRKMPSWLLQAAFNAEQVMKRSDLNDMFGNIKEFSSRFLTQYYGCSAVRILKTRTEFG